MSARAGLIATAAVIVIAMLSIALHQSCRKPQKINVDERAESGEPESYSATVVRIIDDGTRQETIITREVRLGEMRRLEWMEDGARRGMIHRPDVNHDFLLDLDERTYVEIPIDSVPRSQASGSANETRDAPNENALQVIERAIDEPLSPINIETQALPDETIDGHSCSVTEERASFADGHAEVTRLFRARDLNGLAIRVECIGAGDKKIVTERREVSTEVSPDLFSIPADFKKVDKLDQKVRQ